MKDKIKPNLKIVGDNSASGGHYNDVRIIGNSVVDGDIECIKFKSVGDTKINGSIKADHLRTVGSVSIEGSVQSDSIAITGDLKSTGDVRAGDLKITGGISTNGTIKGDNIRLTGYVAAKKNCEGESFRSDGQLSIGGLLNADEIDIRAYGQSGINEIGGDKIVVRKGRGILRVIKSALAAAGFCSEMLEVDSIEGDEIRLEYTKAKVVRGKDVIIDNGCNIELVEYKDSLRVRHGSTVKQKRKI